MCGKVLCVERLASEVMVVHSNILVYSSEWLALRIATLTRNWMMVQTRSTVEIYCILLVLTRLTSKPSDKLNQCNYNSIHSILLGEYFVIWWES